MKDNLTCGSCGHVELETSRQNGGQTTCSKCGERHAPPDLTTGAGKIAPLRGTFGCTHHARIPTGVKLRYTTAGFVKFACPVCRSVVTHRLAAGSKLLYWLFALGVPVWLIAAYRDYTSGAPIVTTPGGLAFLLFGVSVYALIRDQLIKHRLESQAG